MTIDTKSVLCGACHVAVQGPANPNPEDVFTCPSCGRADSLENVMASAEAFFVEATKRHMQEVMRKAARGNDFLKVTGKPVKQGNHPFIVNLKM